MKKVAAVIVLLLAAYLAGYVPEYLELRDTKQELQQARQEIAGIQFRNELAELRDLIGFVYLEASQKNYGLAAQQTTRFFNKLQEIAGRSPEGERKKMLEEMLTSRDAVTAGLANADSAVLWEVQNLFRKTHEATK